MNKTSVEVENFFQWKVVDLRLGKHLPTFPCFHNLEIAFRWRKIC